MNSEGKNNSLFSGLNPSTENKSNPFNTPQFNIGGFKTGSSFSFNSTLISSYEFNFGTGKTFTANNKAPFGKQQQHFNTAASFQSFNNNNNKDKEGSNDDGENIEVSIKNENSGEENEETLINEEVKVFQFVINEKNEKNGKKPGEYAERGNGPLHFNKGDDYYRIIIRNAVGATIVNSRIFESMKPILLETKSMIRILLQNLVAKENDGSKENDKNDEKDSQENDKKDPKKNNEKKDPFSVYLLKFKNPNLAKASYEKINDAITSINKK